MDFKNLLIFSAFLINFFLSLLIHFRSSKSKANITFEVTAFGITAWCLAIIFYRMADVTTAVYWTKLLYFFPTFIPTAFLLFGLYFPNHEIRKRTLFTIIYLNILMSFFVMFDGSVIKDVVLVAGHEKKIIFGPLYYALYPLYITGFFLASYYTLFRKYLKANPYIRMQILYILLGMTAASMPAMVTNLNLPTFGYFELNWVGQLFTVFWIGGVSYAIIKHRLIDIRFVVARTIAYAFLIILLGVVYSFSLFFIAGAFLKGEMNQVVSAVLAIFIAISSQPLRRIVERVTDRLFYKGFYDSQKLLASLSSIMATTLDIDSLAKDTLDIIVRQMRITSGTYTLYVKKNGAEYVEQRGSFVSGIDKNVLDFLMSQPDNIMIREELPGGGLRELLRETNIAVVLKLVTKSKKIGILALSDKRSGDIYSQQDIKVFEILAPELSIAIHNAEEYEQIKQFNITLKSEVDRATKELVTANDKLQELDKLKDEFVSLASHELRTPMSVIKSYVWSLLEGKTGEINDKQKDYLEKTYSTTDRLINLVNDMLNVSRIESGRFTIEVAKADLDELVGEVVAEMQARAQEFGVQLLYKNVDLPPVIADMERTKQVLINLIGNSLKFTPKAGVIKVETVVEGKFVKVIVSDNGRGISSEDLQKLFQKFNMVGKTNNTKQVGQGTGLGLYLSKSLIELQGGKIWAASEGEGKGSVFSFTLPLFEEDQAVGAPVGGVPVGVPAELSK